MKKTLGLLLLLSSSVFARELTLDQAIQMALDNSKEMQISQRDVETAKLNVGIAFKKHYQVLCILVHILEVSMIEK